MSSRIHLLLCTILIGTLSSQAEASLVTVSSADLPNQCDVLAPLPTIVDELGTSVFPLDELIAASAITPSNAPDACSSSSPLIPNVEMRITNLTNRSFTDLHYVSDPGTGFTNFDGVINGFEAVRLDNVGVNRPLILESGGSFPLVFEPNETWTIILDDWMNGAGLGADDLSSIGVPSSVPGDLSSGSIVAIPLIPEPATCSLLLCGVALIVRRVRS